MSNEAIVEWLDKAAAATKSNTVDRAVVLYLARNATVATAAAPRLALNPAKLGLSTDWETGRAFRELLERGWIERGWILTIPELPLGSHASRSERMPLRGAVRRSERVSPLAGSQAREPHSESSNHARKAGESA